ncbi:MAG: type II toxin-antitoxin system Phd/YefM family antitoxin [Acidimicrobiaceae bacterium]|nr:type II toxin-antitoxin system Phd/YefM family antitoxin [Acidimicrobiaceae bacterium]
MTQQFEQVPKDLGPRADIVYMTSYLTSLLPRGLSREDVMTGTWQVQEAKSRFSEFLQRSLSDGPQIVTLRGVPSAVLLPIEEWERLERSARPNLKDWLLAPHARTDDLTPARRDLRRRPPPNLG